MVLFYLILKLGDNPRTYKVCIHNAFIKNAEKKQKKY